MRRITSLFVWKVLAQADESLDKSSALRSLGINPDAPVDPSVMVSDDDYYSFFAAVANAGKDGASLPLRVGNSMRCDDYGSFGLAWKSAPDLRGSYERLARYAKVLTNVAEYEVRDIEEGVLMILHREGIRTLGLRMSNEATIASIVSVSQQASSKPFHPLKVFFKHAGPGFSDIHEDHFGCPVEFNSELDALLVSKEAMSTPNHLGDPTIAKFFDDHLDQVLEKMDDDFDLARQVRICVSHQLSEGIPTISKIATNLGMSGRTLQRRLGENGYSFQNLVDEARRQLAEKLLRETDYPLIEIAFLTGFSEQSAFTRAFKRWAGQTPRSFRLKL